MLPSWSKGILLDCTTLHFHKGWWHAWQCALHLFSLTACWYLASAFHSSRHSHSLSKHSSILTPPLCSNCHRPDCDLCVMVAPYACLQEFRHSPWRVCSFTAQLGFAVITHVFFFSVSPPQNWEQNKGSQLKRRPDNFCFFYSKKYEESPNGQIGLEHGVAVVITQLSLNMQFPYCQITWATNTRWQLL